jgi:hypothetical protein
VPGQDGSSSRERLTGRKLPVRAARFLLAKLYSKRKAKSKSTLPAVSRSQTRTETYTSLSAIKSALDTNGLEHSTLPNLSNVHFTSRSRIFTVKAFAGESSPLSRAAPRTVPAT